MYDVYRDDTQALRERIAHLEKELAEAHAARHPDRDEVERLRATLATRDVELESLQRGSSVNFVVLAVVVALVTVMKLLEHFGG